MKNFEVLITSPPDREKLVAEIWQGKQMIAEINQENEKLELEIYAGENRRLILNYDQFLEALKVAKEKLG